MAVYAAVAEAIDTFGTDSDIVMAPHTVDDLLLMIQPVKESRNMSRNLSWISSSN